MKVIPIAATAVVISFAAIGFAAGTLMGNEGMAAPEPSVQQTSVQPALAVTQDILSDRSAPAHDQEAEAILRAAEAQSASDPAPSRPIADAAQNSAGSALRPHVVKMANVTLPVRKPASISFVVADLAVAVRDADSVAHYDIPQNAARLQAAIEQAMARAADTQILRGVSIDSQQLSGKLTSELQADFADVEDVLFLTLYKHDVGYN